MVTCEKESWVPKNWCFWTVVLEKTLESPLDCKEIQPVHPKGDQSWVFIGRTDAEAETPVLWPPDAKSWLIGKEPDAGKKLKAEVEGDDRRWDCLMASPTWWPWLWVGSRSWWWTGKPGMLLSMELQRVRHSWTDWTDMCIKLKHWDLLNLKSYVSGRSQAHEDDPRSYPTVRLYKYCRASACFWQFHLISTDGACVSLWCS